ncbi:MAG: ribosome recycling factor [Rothia sp. (in: high G+C Gram-positive bacteria)]|nr:ribosome recycling factor [Rothia sp. (in: high G+C Gram-positive bacteria)]
MGFNLDGIKDKANEGVDAGQDAVNEKAGKDVVNEDHANQAKDKAGEQIDGLGDKFGK